MKLELWIEIRILLVSSCLLLVPGWFILVVSGLWRRWRGIQGWFLAFGVSIAFYPVLYYALRTLLPMVQLGRNKLWLMLAIMLLATIWVLHRQISKPGKWSRWGWLVLLVLALTLFTRLWLAHLYPYPAWTDSLHHSILTQLTASNGQIPTNMLPYDSATTSMYHLGLYALSAPLQILAEIPAHSALLWMGQILNGLCGVGVFLLLERKVGRLGAITGMVIAGLVSIMPAYYFNWGRYTQVGAQSILLIAALVTWEAIRAWRKEWPINKAGLIWLTVLAALFNAGVFLVHFQVAGYTLPLLVVIVWVEFIQAAREKKRIWLTLMAGLVIAVISLLLILPALLPAFDVYYGIRATTAPDDVTRLENIFYFSWQGVFAQTGKLWFLLLAGFSLLIGLTKKPREFIVTVFLWLVLMLLEGFLYLLDIPLLAFTNLSGILIMLYLPISLIVGNAAQTVYGWTPKPLRIITELVLLVVVVAGGAWGAVKRVEMIEPARQLMTLEDEQAMAWIAVNTPEDAVFAVNSEMWLPGYSIGTDGGYWIPYFTSRETTSGTMLGILSDANDQQKTVAETKQNIADQQMGLDMLCELGVTFAYQGAKPVFSGTSMDFDKLLTLPEVISVYHNENVQVLRLCP